jgi:phospholipase C
MFAGRTHSTFIELNQNEEKLFQLPPISIGPVIVRVFDAFRTKGPNNTTIFHSGPSSDVKMELRRGKDPAKAGTNFILTESKTHDSLWRLRMKRQFPGVDLGNLPPVQRYRIEATYLSHLPVIERPIPVSFFHDGFEANWNRQEYLRVRLAGSFIQFHIDADLRLLYGLEPVYSVDVSPISFRKNVEALVRLDVGVGPRTVPPPGKGGDRLFFSARVDFPANTIDIDLPGPIDLDKGLPPSFLIFRFYLSAGANGVSYEPEFDSNLLKLLDFTISLPSASDLIRTIHVGDTVKAKVEDALGKLQQAKAGDDPRKTFSGFLKPWLVGGPEELATMNYKPGAGDVRGAGGIAEPATGELIVGYVGALPPPNRDPVLQIIREGPEPAPEPVDDRSVKLFNLPDEDPDPIPIEVERPKGGGLTPFGSGGGPRPQIGALAKIEHIVVLMQENRSFDQVLGYLSLDGSKRVNGLLPSTDPDSKTQFNRFKGRNFFPQKADVKNPPRVDPIDPVTAWPSFALPGPCHDTKCVLRQMEPDPEANNPMGNFVANFAERIGVTDLGDFIAPNLRLVMDYFDGDQLPVYKILADEFGICDKWYTSHAGPTWPNRFVLVTGDLNRDEFGNVEEDNPALSTFVPIQRRTIFDILTERGASWRIFEHGYSFLRLFKNFTFDVTNIVPFDDLTRGFEKAAREGLLPQVTLIEPDYIDLPPGNDDHPPADMKAGQDLVQRIVSALIASEKWNSTLFIITYDEHGGFYDHKVPPQNAPPLLNLRKTLGPRVPAFVISPLIPRRTVFSEPLDHTSIGATILRCFAGRPPKVSPRMDAARDLRDLLTLSEPRPRAEFAKLFDALPPPQPLRSTARNLDAARAKRVPPPQGADDFHGFLAAVRLTTGEPPKRSALRQRVPQQTSGELLFYRDKARNGTGTVANPSSIAKNGWSNLRLPTSGGNGAIYAVDQQGRLLFFRDKTQDGTGDIGEASVIGQGGWQHMRSIHAGNNGILYAVDQQGRLLFYRDRTQNGTGDVANPALIGGSGWQNFTSIFTGGDGIIYAVDQQGRLLFFEDKTQNGTGAVAGPSVIGLGGWQNLRASFGGGDGVIYAVDQQGRLLFYRDKNRNGSGDVANPAVIGLGGWQNFAFLFSGGSGTIYAVRP